MSRGFTLIEALVTTALLVAGLAGVASLFSYSVRTNIHNHERTAATFLVQQKMEELKFTSWEEEIWDEPSGSEYVRIDSDGAPCIRTWNIRGTTPRTVTVVVYAQAGAFTRRRTELARATTIVSAGF